MHKLLVFLMKFDISDRRVIDQLDGIELKNNKKQAKLSVLKEIVGFKFPNAECPELKHLVVSY